jgi:hypothetical protein
MNRISIQVTAFKPRSKLVSVRWPTRLFAREPKTVRLPVLTTTAVPAPLITVVPMKHRLLCSSGLALCNRVWSADFSTTPERVSYFSTGIDSPLATLGEPLLREFQFYPGQLLSNLPGSGLCIALEDESSKKTLNRSIF